MKKLLEKLYRKLKGISPKFPLKVIKYWYTGRWYLYRSDLNDKGLEARSDYVEYPIEGMFMFNPYKCGLCGHDNDSKNGLIEGLVPAYKEGNKIGLYKLVKQYSSNCGSDRLDWDNGMYADFVLVKIIKVKK